MRFAVLSNDPRSPGDYSWIGGVSGGGKDELIDNLVGFCSVTSFVLPYFVL